MRRRFLARPRFRLRLGIIYLGSQSAPASLVISSLVRLYVEREDEDRAAPPVFPRPVVCCPERKKIPGCVFSAPVLQSLARTAGLGIAAILSCVRLIGENNLSIGRCLRRARRRYILSRVLKSRNTRFNGGPTNREFHVRVHAYAPRLHLCLYVRRLSQRAGSIREQA